METYLLSKFAEKLNITNMEALTVREFRSNLAASFDKVDAGERVLVLRNSKMYTLVPVENDDLLASPELLAKIEQARKEIREGNCVTCKTKEELEAFLKSL